MRAAAGWGLFFFSCLVVVMVVLTASSALGKVYIIEGLRGGSSSNSSVVVPYQNAAAGWENLTTGKPLTSADNVYIGSLTANENRLSFAAYGFTGGAFLRWFEPNGYFQFSEPLEVHEYITIDGSQVCTQGNGLCAATVPYQNAAAGWSNATGQVKTDKIVNITGALCLGAENGVMPCRNFFGDEESARRYMSVQMDPFIGGGAETGEYGSWGWSSTLVGTGTDVTAGASPDETCLGAISVGSGTVAAGNASLTASPGLIFVNGSSGLTGWFARVRVDAVSDGAQNVTVIVGFSDLTTSAVGVDAIAAVYNSTTNLGHFWSFRSCANSVCTNNVTTQTVAANVWYDLECQIYNATRADCYVNGVLSASLWTNIPSGTARTFYPGRISMNKNLGVTERRLYVDYYGVYRVFNTPKW